MKKYIAVVSMAVIVIAGLTWWSWKQLHISPVETNVLRLSLDNAVESLDPAKAYGDDALVVASQVLEPLYQYHYLKRPYEIQPLLADSMPLILEKGSLVKIKLKKGIFFHDHPAFMGKPRELVADDLVMQFKRLAMAKLKSPGRSLFAGLIKGFEEYDDLIGGNWKKLRSTNMEGVSAPDESTLLIHLSKAEPNLIYYLALNFVIPVPWELVDHYKNEFDNVLVGTGPYVYKGFNGQYFAMERNNSYREDFYPSSGDRYANVKNLLDSSKERIPFIGQVRFYLTSQENERWEKFLKHEIDLLTVPKTFLPKLYDEKGDLSSDLKSKDIELKHFPILANRWLGFNMRHPVMGTNEYLRRAIAYSIDYDQYIQILSQNTNLRANSILVPGISGYAPAKALRLKYDINLAREYLKLAGFTPGKMPKIVYSTRGNQGINLVEAEFIKKMLAAIGLEIEIEVLTFPEFLKKGRAGELMFFTDNWLFDYPDGENILQLLVSTNFPGINKSGYSNKAVDELYYKLKETINLDQRDKIIHEMEELVFSDLPWIPLMYESSFVVQYPEIKNFRKSSLIRNYVKYLKIER
ncbi:MAG TPA: ABC transporter substrate-binding protein [Bacteriovoracaceae bacterium]|nr:ABC transporter substrate-binding protein [Bacteriovoracaceae bacterium]